MKLYATTTSDRKDAKSGHNISRGLGGNEHLNITLSREINRQNTPVYFIGLYQNEMVVEHIPTQTEVYRESKGKQKKGEVIEWYKKNTGKSPDCPHYINSGKYNPDGWKFCTQCKKGKQKKGERIGGDDRQFKDWPVNGA